VRITMGDAKLRADLHKLRKVASATGAPRFVADRDDDHADRTWAAFLGIHAASEGQADYDYRPVSPATPSQQAKRFDDPGEDEDFRRGWWTPPLGAGVRGGLLGMDYFKGLTDQWGRPIEKRLLTEEIAAPTITGVRSPLHRLSRRRAQSAAAGSDPARGRHRRSAALS
jgi:hypothetical protein